MAGAPPSVALCIVGLLARLTPDREGFRRVAEHLGADTFAVLTRRGDDLPPRDLLDWAWEVLTPQDLGIDRLREEALQVDRGGRVLQALSQWPLSFYAHPLSAPAGAEYKDTGLLQLWDVAMCYARVRAREADRGSMYRYVIYTRADVFWFTTLPPLSLLERVHPLAVWIPDGQDSDGLNDRMAIVPRRWAELYFNRWGLLLNGTLLPHVRRAEGAFPERGAEWLLYVALRAYGVPVLRFSAVAALLCIGAGKPAHSSCSRPFIAGSERIRFKYSQEAVEASLSARMLESGEWTWRPASTPWLVPGCFASDDEAKSCCNETHGGWGGWPECFTDIWMFWRCCGLDAGRRKGEVSAASSPLRWRWDSPAPRVKAFRGPVDGVWVAPRSKQALLYAMQGQGQFCVRVSEGISRCVDLVELSEKKGYEFAPAPGFFRNPIRMTDDQMREEKRAGQRKGS